MLKNSVTKFRSKFEFNQNTGEILKLLTFFWKWEL